MFGSGMASCDDVVEISVDVLSFPLEGEANTFLLLRVADECCKTAQCLVHVLVRCL